MRILLVVVVAAAASLSCSGRVASCTCGERGAGPNGGTEWACNFNYGDPQSGECKDNCVIRRAPFGGDDVEHICEGNGCCAICEDRECACGNSCIPCGDECNASPGCACNAD